MKRLPAASLALLICACGAAPEVVSDDEAEIAVEPGSDALEGKADTVDGNVELKVTLRSDQVSKGVSTFKLTDAKASFRDVYFYDTPSLALFDKGLILRSRKLKSGADDSTVKMRPLLASDVDRSWFDLDGFKCEEDRTGTKSVQSCSLSVTQDRGEIDDVAAGKRTIDKLFSGDQEDFAKDYSPLQPNWSTLKALGPVKARVWKVSARGFAYKLSVERWVLPNGTDLVEISTKVAATVADRTAAQLDTFLKGKGFDTTAKQETKTRVALDYFRSR